MSKIALCLLWFGWLVFVTGVTAIIVKPDYTFVTALGMWSLGVIIFALNKES